MEKEFVPYEIALALKELGFDKSCLKCWFPNPNGDNHILINSNTILPNQYLTIEQLIKEGIFLNTILAPLYQQVFRWLYQKLDIEKGVMPLDTESQQLLLKELIDKVSSKHLLV